MGVPKFFRYMSERYPCLSELLTECQIPDFDNMYLDMNGIIHVCSHPNDNNVHFRITEDKIFQDIFKYIEVLFRLIQPKKLFFMAVDGVAPRAKMNHQRGRRFRSAKDATTQEALASKQGEKLPDEKRFDSNCITPGTLFMVKLQKQLQNFVNQKISHDKMWRKIKIILSGHECPGEGEHKIMDYIRYIKSRKDYDPNTRHCIYGLDADLIMLGLCTHEPYFSLLREEVKFGKSNNMRCMTAEEINFYLLHLSVMRDYLDLEFQELKNTLPFPYDLECVINDWVLMGFLVGNDFIPHLPNFHIANGALPILYRAYMDVLPTLDGYLNEEGTLNLPRFEVYLKKLAEYDEESFREKTIDLKYFEGKRTRSLKPFDSDELDEVVPDEPDFDDPELAALVKATDDLEADDFDEESRFNDEFYADKKDYYKNKMNINMNDLSISQQTAVYIEAIQWNLHYYYDGCCSWSWFYPYHYAPYVSDVTNFKDLKLNFTLSQPFLPFQQLLAVLPPASKELLPVPYQLLMTQETSPIIEYYPEDFETDLNGKKQDWEAVVLLPFIEESLLKSAMSSVEDQLTDEEKKRNSHGGMHIYSYTEEASERPSNYDEPLKPCVKVEVKYRGALSVERSELVKGLCKGVNLGAYMFGFPTLRHIPFTASIEKAKVMVFEQPSRNESIILNIKTAPVDVSELATKILNKVIYVDWPFIAPAKASQIFSAEEKFILESDGKISCRPMTKADKEALTLSINTVQTRYNKKKGINVGDSSVVIFAHKLIGQKRVFTKNGMVSFEREFDTNGSYYVHQAVVIDIGANEFGKTEFLTLEEVYKPKSNCFMLGHPHYGSFGKVIEVSKTGRVKIDVTVMDDPNFEDVKKNSLNGFNNYMKPHHAASRLGISSHLLSRITGTILVTKPSDDEVEGGALKKETKINIGLNLKLAKKNEVVPGYVRKTNLGWLYSPKSLELLVNYMKKYPYVFEHVDKNKGEGYDVYKAKDLFPSASDPAEELNSLVKWLKSEPFYSIPRISCLSDFLEHETVNDLYTAVNKFHASKHKKKNVVLEVKPHLLLQPVEKLDVKLADPTTEFELFDRVICIRDSFTVPLGLKGTVVGIQKDKPDMDVKDILIIVLFDKDFTTDESLDPVSRRTRRLHAQGLINISHGDRMTNKSTPSKPTQVADRTAGAWRQNSSQSAFASVDYSQENWRENKYQAPRAGVSGQKFYSGNSKNELRRHDVHTGPYQTPEMFFKQNVRDSHAPSYKNAVANSSLPKQQTPVFSSNDSDYQTMWQELKKAGNSKAEPSIMDPSNALKKMLQIAPKSPTSLRPETNFSQTSKTRPAYSGPSVNVNNSLSHNVQTSSPFPLYRNQSSFSPHSPTSNVFNRNGNVVNAPMRTASFPSGLPPPPVVAQTFGKRAPPVLAPNIPQNKNDLGSLAPFSNPFVPLQVTRNQVSNVASPTGTSQIAEHLSGQKLKSSNDVTGPLVSSPSASNGKNSEPRKSRIAAKFMAPPDSRA